MEKQAAALSEREIVERIIHLHENVRLGFRRIAKKLAQDNIVLSKDRVHRLYRKHRPASVNEVEALTDRELELLRRRVKGAERRARLAREKLEMRKQIADLMVEEAMNSFRIRNELFSNRVKLLRFLEKVMPVVDPSLWIEFRNHCMTHGYDLEESVEIAVGEPTDYEARLASSPNENQRLQLYFRERLRECMQDWKEQEGEENKEAERPDQVQTSPEYEYIIIELDKDLT